MSQQTVAIGDVVDVSGEGWPPDSLTVTAPPTSCPCAVIVTG